MRMRCDAMMHGEHPDGWMDDGRWAHPSVLCVCLVSPAPFIPGSDGIPANEDAMEGNNDGNRRSIGRGPLFPCLGSAR